MQFSFNFRFTTYTVLGLRKGCELAIALHHPSWFAYFESAPENAVQYNRAQLYLFLASWTYIPYFIFTFSVSFAELFYMFLHIFSVWCNFLLQSHGQSLVKISFSSIFSLPSVPVAHQFLKEMLSVDLSFNTMNFSASVNTLLPLSRRYTHSCDSGPASFIESLCTVFLCIDLISKFILFQARPQSIFLENFCQDFTC